MLYANPYPRVKEKVKGCAFTTKGFYLIAAVTSTHNFPCLLLYLHVTHWFWMFTRHPDLPNKQILTPNWGGSLPPNDGNSDFSNLIHILYLPYWTYYTIHFPLLLGIWGVKTSKTFAIPKFTRIEMLEIMELSHSLGMVLGVTSGILYVSSRILLTMLFGNWFGKCFWTILLISEIFHHYWNLSFGFLFLFWAFYIIFFLRCSCTCLI